MNSIAKRFIWVSVYAIAMAYLEATVVVYLRAVLGITDITAIDVSLGPYGLIEIGREAATVAMLAAVGWIAGRHWKERWAYGLFAFGFWDLLYYQLHCTKALPVYGAVDPTRITFPQSMTLWIQDAR